MRCRIRSNDGKERKNLLNMPVLLDMGVSVQLSVTCFVQLH